MTPKEEGNWEWESLSFMPFCLPYLLSWLLLVQNIGYMEFTFTTQEKNDPCSSLWLCLYIINESLSLSHFFIFILFGLIFGSIYLFHHPRSQLLYQPICMTVRFSTSDKWHSLPLQIFMVYALCTLCTMRHMFNLRLMRDEFKLGYSNRIRVW